MDFWWIELIEQIFIKTVVAIVDPASYFWLVMLVIGVQYYRMARQKAKFFGVAVDRVWPTVLIATGWGILGGLLGSLLLTFLGITVAEMGLSYLWPIALGLMLINPRFLCFAYAGGLLSLSYLFFGWPVVNVAQIMALVAVLHLVESLLILVSGHLGAMPAYFKIPSGHIVGAFTLQRFWPIPLFLLIAVNQLPGYDIHTPDWWPIIRDNDFRPNTVYVLAFALAALGYGDVAVSRTPKEKSKISAWYLSIFSVLLLLFSILAGYFTFFIWVAAFFGPLGHELVIKIGRDAEFSGKPLYQRTFRGLKVLDVVAGSPAAKIGIHSGDILLTINGWPVKFRHHLEEALWAGAGTINIEVVKPDGQLEQKVLSHVFGERLGVITVPEENEPKYMEQIKGNWLIRKMSQWRKKFFGS